jgi:hypothetical protein
MSTLRLPDLKVGGSACLPQAGVAPEQGLTPPNGSIFFKPDGLGRALVYAGPSFNAILRVGRIGFVFFDLIDFTGTDLGTISAAITFFLIDDRIHGYFKFQISND